MNDFTTSKASLCAFSVWLCRSLESSSLLLHFSGYWLYLFRQDGWYCASQANRSTPLILVNRCSSCFSCAIHWTVTPPSYSNRTVPSVVQLPFTLTFFLPSFSQNIQSGLNIILSGSRDLRRLLSKSLLPAMDCGGAGKSDSGSLWTSGSNPCGNPTPQKK